MMTLGLMELRRTNRGLQQLAKVSDAIGGGNFKARAESGRSDSVGLLGKAINTMAERIQSSIREREESQLDSGRALEQASLFETSRGLN